MVPYSDDLRERLVRRQAPPGGAPPKLTAAHEQRLIDAVKNQPDAPLAQLRQACGAPVTCAAIGQHRQKLKLGRKKKHLHPSEQEAPEVVREAAPIS